MSGRRRAAVLFAAILAGGALAACGTPNGGGGAPGGGGGTGRSGGAEKPERRLAPWETYVRSPTEIRADEVRVVAPDFLRSDLKLSGLSAGFAEKDGATTWEGTGECRLELFELEVRCRKLVVSLLPVSGEPEFLLTATGPVILAHVSGGIGNLSENLDFLMIRNDRRLER